ncbi:Uncharacterised protein [uncultured archaeon]|nr:Uncharacterised protein [uncultured archaeon]
MILNIPISSTPLLVAAALIDLGLIVYVISAKLGVLAIGAGSVIMGVVVLLELPRDFLLQGTVLFGITVVVGAWMMYIGIKSSS